MSDISRFAHANLHYFFYKSYPEPEFIFALDTCVIIWKYFISLEMFFKKSNFDCYTLLFYNVQSPDMGGGASGNFAEGAVVLRYASAHI